VGLHHAIRWLNQPADQTTFAHWPAPRPPSPISSNSLFRTVVIVLLIAHAGILLGFWLAPRTINFLLGLNAVLAISVLTYCGSRARYILSPIDWPFLGLIAFEALVLAGAIWAFRGSRLALIGSYVAFGLHTLVSLAAVIFAFVFKIKRLM
jgi:hypothetical protein